jgi:hypothetical protein
MIKRILNNPLAMVQIISILCMMYGAGEVYGLPGTVFGFGLGVGLLGAGR